MTADKEDQLIDFSSVEPNLGHVSEIRRGVMAIPIKKIVGSIGRYRDFNQEFLPRSKRHDAKYVSILSAVQEGVELPPVQVYQVQDKFFVIDGHHRISVAKFEQKKEFIDAEIFEVKFDFVLDPKKKYKVSTEEATSFLIGIEAEVFQRKTHLRNTILAYPLKVTELTSFSKLYEEIINFRKNYENGALAGKDVIYASFIWYENRFMPAVRTILEDDLLQRFPARTYTDLYVWVNLHKYFLSQKAGHDVGFDYTKRDFVKRFSPTHIFEVLPERVKDIMNVLRGFLPK